MSDAKQEGKEKAEAAAPAGKKKLPAVVLVAVGAALGGAGVVFLAPKPKEQQAHEPAAKFELVESPDVIRLHFNPWQERGSMTAKLEFTFVYKLDTRHKEDVLALIKNHWNQMFSRVLLRARRETPAALKDPDAVGILESDLIKEMSLSLFPNGEAVVEQIVWKSIYTQ